jgi:hypothetical protein
MNERTQLLDVHGLILLVCGKTAGCNRRFHLSKQKQNKQPLLLGY